MYGKLFESMYDGTLGARGPWEALVTFQQLVILADQDGVVDMTPEAISRRTTIPLDIVAKGLAALEQPDPDSRTPDEDGRRIVRLSDSRAWGWRVTNYQKYRAIRTADERRAYHRQYQRKRRAAAVNSVNHVSTEFTKGRSKSSRHRHEAEAPAAGSSLCSEPSAGKPPRVAPMALPDWLDPEKFRSWIAIRPSKARTPAAQQAAIEKLERLRGQGHDPNAIIAESLANGWQGIFPPKGGNGQQPVQTLAERNRSAVAEATRRHQEEEAELQAFATEAGMVRERDEDDAHFRDRVRAERHARGRAHVQELKSKFAGGGA